MSEENDYLYFFCSFTVDDKCMPEREDCAFEISEEVFETYKNDPYNHCVLNDLIASK